MLELLISSLGEGVIILILLGAAVLAVFTILMPVFVFQIRNTLKNIDKKITKPLDNYNKEI